MNAIALAAPSTARRWRQFAWGFAGTLAFIVLAAGVLYGLGKIGQGAVTAELAGRVLVMGGMFTAFLLQWVACAVLLPRHPREAVMAFIVPGYLMLALVRTGHFAWLFGAYVGALACLGAGTIVLS